MGTRPQESCSNFRLKVKIPVSHKITVYLSMTIEIID